jgi:hypothetical protein
VCGVDSELMAAAIPRIGRLLWIEALTLDFLSRPSSELLQAMDFYFSEAASSIVAIG